MDDLLDRFDPERAWAAIVGGLTLALVVGALVSPERVYDRFLWQYFWGPVAADGQGANCAVREGGTVEYLDSATACAAADGVVAYPGYTTISTVSYAIVLVFLLIGVYFFVRRLEVGTEPSLVVALFPWMLFGGALRTLEDASIAVLRETGDPLIAFPYSAAIISPFIYFTVFVLVAVALLVSVWAANADYVEDWKLPLSATGTVLFLLVTGYLLYLTTTMEIMGLRLLFLSVVVIGSILVTALVWVLTERHAPVVNAGTGVAGALIVFGHTLDGIANVLSLDHAAEFNLAGTYQPKHVVNAGIRDLMTTLQPEWLSATIGTTWPFFFLKVGAAVAVVWLFNDEMVEESPRYSVLLLTAVLAVGLGPGTRDLLRATFGI